MKIIKYNNRRLYSVADSGKRGYVTLDDVVKAMRSGVPVQVCWHDGPDITRDVLMQALEHVESQREQPKLSVDKLCELIWE